MYFIFTLGGISVEMLAYFQFSCCTLYNLHDYIIMFEGKSHLEEMGHLEKEQFCCCCCNCFLLLCIILTFTVFYWVVYSCVRCHLYFKIFYSALQCMMCLLYIRLYIAWYFYAVTIRLVFYCVFLYFRQLQGHVQVCE